MIQKLKPACKDYLWGGTKLKEIYKKETDMNPLAETWELSAHPDGESIICGGKFDGVKFSDYITAEGKDILGKNVQKFDKFPVLIKFIDAKQPLSVQVHPDDEFGLEIEGEYGKTEMWYVMDCEEGASLYFGVNQEISREDFNRKIVNNSVEEVLNKVPVKKGDVFFIEAGTIHAIGAGILICEIQQNSNTTYRVYDYGRQDAVGNLRELHIEKALAVSNLTPTKPVVFDDDKSKAAEDNVEYKKLAECKYFTTEHYKADEKLSLTADENSFVSLVILSGKGTVADSDGEVSFEKGDSLFIPAHTGEIELKGSFELIKTTV